MSGEKENSKDLVKLLKGVVVIIDEKVNLNDKDDPIYKIANFIEHSQPVVRYSQLPSDRHLESFSGISFIILDWNHHGIEYNDTGASALKKDLIDENVKFISKVRENIFCPIFIFSTLDVESIQDELKTAGLFDRKSSSNNLLIVNKSDVHSDDNDRVYDILTAWLSEHPSFYVIKEYEYALKKGMVDLSWSFYNVFPKWPLVFWKTFKKDEVNRSHAFIEMLNNCLNSRVNRTRFDENILGEDIELSKVRAEVRAVMENERMYYRDFSHGDDVSTGDLFMQDSKYILIVSPLCDCIARNGLTNFDLSYMYIQGDSMKNPELKKIFIEDYGFISEKDSHTVLFPINKGKIVNFKFKVNQLLPYATLCELVYIGRVNAPYITKIQQKYSSYLQRPGTPRIPKEAIVFEAK